MVNLYGWVGCGGPLKYEKKRAEKKTFQLKVTSRIEKKTNKKQGGLILNTIFVALKLD